MNGGTLLRLRAVQLQPDRPATVLPNVAAAA